MQLELAKRFSISNLRTLKKQIQMIEVFDNRSGMRFEFAGNQFKKLHNLYNQKELGKRETKKILELVEQYIQEFAQDNDLVF